MKSDCGGINGVNSIVPNSSKSLATIVGNADPFEIIKKLRKLRRSVEFVNIGLQKEEKDASRIYYAACGI